MEQAGYTCMDGTRQSGNNVFLGTSACGQPLVAYSNQRTDDYLTPTSPASDQPPPLLSFPASFGRSQSQPHGVLGSKALTPTGSVPDQPPLLPSLPAGLGRSQSQPHGPQSNNSHHPFQSFPRADSGIVADSPRSPTSSTSTAPRSSTVYEYIDPKDVTVDSRPHDLSQGSIMQAEGSSSGVSSATAGSALYNGDTVFNSEDGTANCDSARRRINPMYEALEKSATRLYARTCHCKVQSSAQRQLRYLWCAFIVIILINIFLLAVIAYILFLLIPSMQAHIYHQEDKIKEMGSNYTRLNQESRALQQLLTNSTSSDAPGAGNVVDMVAQLNSSVWMVHSQMQAVSMDLQQQIHNISLTPGPRGPPGVGNLSSCFYYKVTSYQLQSGAESTSWQPTLNILKDNIVMSATCEVLNGRQQSVDANFLSSNAVQYRCRCDGTVDSSQRRTCRVHLVLCPRLTTLDLPTSTL